MNIKQYINSNCEDGNFDGEAIYIEEGCRINLNNFLKYKISIKTLKTMEGDAPEIEFCFCGEIDVKIGLFRDGYSFTWLYEAKLYSSTITQQKIHIDLSSFIDGDLELMFLGLQESTVFALSPTIDDSPIPKENILFDFSFPTFDLCCEEQLYHKLIGSNIYYSFEEKNIYMGKGTSADFLTYFNSFSACKWSKYTNVENISLYVDFIGSCEFTIISKDESDENVILSYNINANKRKTFEIPIAKWPKDGILGLRVFANKRSCFYGGGWLSSDAETQHVKLGIGITTFKREKFVKSAVSRLAKAIADHHIYNSIDITVVDNGKTLSAEDVEGATLIPNENLGGTGGFTRNLLHYKDADEYTHVLFMDDDASCEPSSIFRSVSFLRHVLDDSIAISGAMLSENIQFIQWESGAYFDKCCHPLHCNYDLRDENILIKNEDEQTPQPLYGAWWFFLFPLKHVSMYSFPFFVRGDDIEFSYTNKFNIVRMNGIGTWQEDFKIKESPLTLYLDTRSHIIHHLLLKHINNDSKTILKMVWAFFRRFNLAYQYDTANAILSAFCDIQKGVQYWKDNMDTSKIRAFVKNKYTIEALQPLRKDYKNIPEATNNVRLPFFTKTIRRLSFNGHLLPSFLVKKGLERLNKYQIPFRDRMFLREKILICNEINNTEITLKRNTKYFFSNMIKMIAMSWLFRIRRKRLAREYNDFFYKLHVDTFWREVFNSSTSDEKNETQMAIDSKK